MCETLGLFGGYQNPGSGINPNAPKKKPFFRYWEVLWHNFSKLISLNLIYTLLHAPMFLAVIFFFETNNKFTYAMTGFLLAVQFLLEGPAMATTLTRASSTTSARNSRRASNRISALRCFTGSLMRS